MGNVSAQIGITRVLSDINSPLKNGESRVFQIGWIRKTGTDKGTMKRIDLARKYSPTGKPKPSKKRSSPHIKTARLLLLEDLSIEPSTPFYVGIETIIEYNGKKVRH